MNKIITKDKWIWMPHPAHFICSQDCHFHMATKVGKWIISTIGELLFDMQVNEILAKHRNIQLEGMGDFRRADWMRKNGWEEIGMGRTYETMVFKAEKSNEKNSCCPYRIASGSYVDFRGYKTSEDAYQGHLELCEEYSKK